MGRNSFNMLSEFFLSSSMTSIKIGIWSPDKSNTVAVILRIYLSDSSVARLNLIKIFIFKILTDLTNLLFLNFIKRFTIKTFRFNFVAGILFDKIPEKKIWNFIYWQSEFQNEVQEILVKFSSVSAIISCFLYVIHSFKVF